MQAIVNDTEYEIPFDLSQISLGKFLEYHDEYGRDLDKELNDILQKKYDGDPDDIELNQTMDLDNHVDKEALAWFSFWTGHDLFELRSHPSAIPLLQQYRVLRFMLKDSVDYELPLTISWNSQDWAITDFKINPASEMDFNEIITSKEVMRQIYKVGKGKWDALPYLCAVYFRKVGEPFSDEFTHEGSERMKLLQDLPLLHALQVAFFLSACVSTWSKTLAFLKKEEGIASLN